MSFIRLKNGTYNFSTAEPNAAREVCFTKSPKDKRQRN